MKCPDCNKDMKLVRRGKNDDVYQCNCNPHIIYTKWVRNKLVNQGFEDE